MRYISCDIETTGLDESCCQILEIAMVDSATGSVFHCYVNNSRIRGEPFALAMHPKTLRLIADQVTGYKYLDISQIVPCVLEWLRSIGWEGKVTWAGKNFAAFDLRFLRQLPEWDTIPQHHRIIDVGSLYLRDDDSGVPDTRQCCVRAGIGYADGHGAYADCLQVINLISAALAKVM